MFAGAVPLPLVPSVPLSPSQSGSFPQDFSPPDLPKLSSPLDAYNPLLGLGKLLDSLFGVPPVADGTLPRDFGDRKFIAPPVSTPDSIGKVPFNGGQIAGAFYGITVTYKITPKDFVYDYGTTSTGEKAPYRGAITSITVDNPTQYQGRLIIVSADGTATSNLIGAGFRFDIAVLSISIRKISGTGTESNPPSVGGNLAGIGNALTPRSAFGFGNTTAPPPTKPKSPPKLPPGVIPWPPSSVPPKTPQKAPDRKPPITPKPNENPDENIKPFPPKPKTPDNPPLPPLSPPTLPPVAPPQAPPKPTNPTKPQEKPKSDPDINIPPQIKPGEQEKNKPIEFPEAPNQPQKDPKRKIPPIFDPNLPPADAPDKNKTPQQQEEERKAAEEQRKRDEEQKRIDKLTKGFPPELPQLPGRLRDSPPPTDTGSGNDGKKPGDTLEQPRIITPPPPPPGSVDPNQKRTPGSGNNPETGGNNGNGNDGGLQDIKDKLKEIDKKVGTPQGKPMTCQELKDCLSGNTETANIKKFKSCDSQTNQPIFETVQITVNKGDKAAVEALAEKLANIEGEQCSPKGDAIALIPEWWQQRAGQIPQLLVRFQDRVISF